MDEGRLAAVRRRTDHNRKSVIVMNDIIKNRQEVYENYLNKEQHGVESKIVAGELGLKRNIVRNNVLMQCLEARKEKMKMKNPSLPLGKYGGRPIHTFSRDIESMISWMHPRLRRLRQVERMKQNGLRLGAIIDPSTVPARIDAVFGERSNSDSRILAGQQTSRRKSSTISRRRRLSKSGGLLDPLDRRPTVTRRRIEAPPFRAFIKAAQENDDLEKMNSDSRRQAIDKANHGHRAPDTVSDATIERRDHLQKTSKNSGVPLITVGDSFSQTDGDTNVRISSNVGVPAADGKESNSPMDKPRTSDFDKGSRKSDGAKQEHRKSLKMPEVKDDSYSLADVDESMKRTRRPTLILPPIKTSRELVKK